MALPDLTGQTIQDTYQRVLQTDGGTLRDGTGSLVNPTVTDLTVTSTGSFGRLICTTISASSGDFDANTIRIGGTSFSKDELDTLKEGKSIRTTEKNLRGDDGNSRDVVVTRGIFSTNDDNTLIKLGSDVIGMVISGSSFFIAQKTDTENRIIAGDGNTQFNLSGSIVSASINGGSF